MRLSITSARKLAETVGARQVVIVAFDGSGQFAVTSYGETKEECAAVRTLCDAIADGLEDGDLPSPPERLVRNTKV